MGSSALRFALAGGLLVVFAAFVAGTATAPSLPRAASPSTPPPSPAPSTSPSTPPPPPSSTAGDGDSTAFELPTATSDASTTDVVAVTTVTATTATAAPSSSGPPTSTGPAVDRVDCTSVVALADAVAAADGIDFGLEWRQLQQTIVDASNRAASSYRAVVAVAPGDVASDLDLLADYNTELGQAATASASITAFQAAATAPSDELLVATRAVDRFMRDSCSIGLTAD